MSEMITIENIPVYKVRPEGACRGGLIVLHEVWGLTDHIKDVAERFGREGYLVYAPNLLTDTDIEQHLTPDMASDLFNPETRSAVQPKLRQLTAPIQTPEFAAETIAKLKKLFAALYQDPTAKQKVAVAGFCFGGTYSFSLAVAEPRLTAAVPFYGHADQSVEELRGITAPILAFYGEKDEALMNKLPALQERMHEADVEFTSQVYGGCGHAFFNDTNPYAYNEQAAKEAWRRTLEFLNDTFASVD